MCAFCARRHCHIETGEGGSSPNCCHKVWSCCLQHFCSIKMCLNGEGSAPDQKYTKVRGQDNRALSEDLCMFTACVATSLWAEFSAERCRSRSRSVLLLTEFVLHHTLSKRDEKKYRQVSHFSICCLLFLSLLLFFPSFLLISSSPCLNHLNQFPSLRPSSSHQTFFLQSHSFHQFLFLLLSYLSPCPFNSVFLSRRFYLYLPVSFHPSLATISPSITSSLSFLPLFSPHLSLSISHLISLACQISAFLSASFTSLSLHFLLNRSPSVSLSTSLHLCSLHHLHPSLCRCLFLPLICSATTYFNHSACRPWNFQRDDPPEGSRCVSNAELQKPSCDSRSVRLSASGRKGNLALQELQLFKRENMLCCPGINIRVFWFSTLLIDSYQNQFLS